MTSPGGWRYADCEGALGGGDTYGIGGGELLLGRDDAAAALGCIERALALDDRLAGSGRAATSAGADLGHLVPVVAHCVGGEAGGSGRVGASVCESCGSGVWVRCAGGGGGWIAACVCVAAGRCAWMRRLGE
jgi:hypothetical protein